MKVFVTGHRGMLGHVVARYLAENGCAVLTSDQRYAAAPRDVLIEEIRASGCAWVVNALGKIKQKCPDADALFAANTLFPIHLKQRLQPGQRLIHASTDCVFSGLQGNYSLTAEPDPEDTYGLSKALGESVAEPDRAFVLRTSVVGPEQNGHTGLMGWFLAQRGRVNGYTNHFWNGITTLEWAKACLAIIQSKQPDAAALWQLGFLPALSKYELLRMFSEIWQHPLEIEPCEAPHAIDRSLIPTWQRCPIREQLLELKTWY